MDRTEWSAVGLVGQLVCDDDGTCLPNRFISATGGIATLSEVQTNVRCMRRVDDTHVLAFIH